MYERRYTAGGGGFGLTGPVPPDLWVLLAIVFATFSLRFFASTAVIPALLRLAPEVWQRGFIWQLATYPFVGTGAADLWFVIELLILFLFGRQALYQLGRRRFWRLLVGVAAGSAAIAALLHVVFSLAGFAVASPFALMQGQRMLLAILIAAFAALNREATILLFFVLPIQAKWFLLLEVVFAFLGFLSTRDVVGFVGVCAAIGLTVRWLRPGSIGRSGRELWLAIQRWWLRMRLAWLRRRRGIRVVRGPDDSGGPWVH